MRIDNAVGAAVLERMLSAYGFRMQKELAEHLGIANSNVAGWVQRGQVPGNAIVQCSIDTGADVRWLVFGQVENARLEISKPSVSGEKLYQEIMANGGKAVLMRVLSAYNFTLQKQLCELLGISSGTVSTWIRRNYFPGDVVVTCALDTGVSLEWLALGHGGNGHVDGTKKLTSNVDCMNLTDGTLNAAGQTFIDFSLYKISPSEPIMVIGNFGAWIVDENIRVISNGKWLISINGMYDIYEVALLPKRKIKVINSASDFTCDIDEVEIKGKVVLTVTQ